MLARKIERAFSSALTIRELIDELQDLDRQGYGDALAAFVCDYGDYHHTRQALPIEQVSLPDPIGKLRESGYSQSGIALEEQDGEEDEDGEDDEEGEDLPKIVIFSDARY